MSSLTRSVASSAYDVMQSHPQFANNSSGVPDMRGLNYVDRTNMQYNAYQAAQDRKFNAEQAELSRRFNAEEAQKTRDWQEHMSNSAYSRAILDLKSAGVNPYALLSGMSASSTPSGATGSGSSAYSNSHSGLYTSSQSEWNSVRGLIGTVISGASSAFAAAIRAGLIV